MAAFTMSGSSLSCVFLARIFVLFAFHSLSAASEVEYSFTSIPSSYLSVIVNNNLHMVRIRRQAVQDDLSTNSSQPHSTVSMSVGNKNDSRLTVTTRIPESVSSSKNSTATLLGITSTIAPSPTTSNSSATTITHVSTNISAAPPTTPPTKAMVTTLPTSKVTTATTQYFSTTTKGLTTPITKIIKDNHIYYTSIIIQHEINEHWINLDDFKHQKHKVLSESHRMAAPVKINFKFRFFGHNIVNLTIATGGFLYMSPFLHKWLTATQYIAPLMANFDTTLGKNSTIRILDTVDLFVVHWQHVHLQDQNTSTPFNFQVALMKNGTIKFIYKQLPILPNKISARQHPVKIGLSDAYYIDSPGLDGTIRTIYEYHRVAIDKTKIQSETVVILAPLPTCNLAQNCDTCISQRVNFSCNWCSAVDRCSDGVDWHRQSWLQNHCHNLTAKRCPMTQSRNTTEEKLSEPKNQLKSVKEAVPVATVIIMVIVLIVCISLGGWCFYGYTHPTTSLGIWMMEHRPSQMKAKMANMKFWKQSTPAGDKYRIESAA